MVKFKLFLSSLNFVCGLKENKLLSSDHLKSPIPYWPEIGFVCGSKENKLLSSDHLKSPIPYWPEIGILARTAKLSKRFKLLPFRLLTLIVFGVAFDERGTRVVYLQIKLLSWFSERWELSF